MVGQPPQSLTNSYIASYAPEAVNQMIEFNIPASVILAQAIFESSCGNSVLARRSNNHFGIKCHTQWGGDTIHKSDDSLNECFRKYNSIKESYTDHSLFLRSRDRYKELFKLPVNDYKGWCHGLKNSGYATYAYYPEVLIKIIEENQLYEFDRIDNLPTGTLICSRKNEIINKKYAYKDLTIAVLNETDVLWVDEKNILIQSLDFIVEQPEIETALVMQSGILFDLKTNEVTESKLTPIGFSLKELCYNDLLWSDERYFLIQSLEMIIDHPEKEEDKIADN
ncbi:MAG: glucosaminidase domain-containing protein [Bacteroidetes bacterium]|nr:glucosaminidase domain-containing protein [Bacteroidota bacterium]